MRTKLCIISSLLVAASCGGPVDDTDFTEPVAETEAEAQATDVSSSPTGWWWYYGQSAGSVGAKVNSLGARIADIEIERSSPLRLSVALVRNSGAHAKAWWWYYGQTASSLATKLRRHGARIADLEPYYVNGQLRFAAVLVRNAGSDGAGWWWYYGLTSSQVSSRLSQNRARLVDIESYRSGGRTRYAVVMVRNTGRAGKAWWWYLNVSGAYVKSRLASNRARLTDIEPANSSGTRFNVVMERCTSNCPTWWWYYNQSPSALGAAVAQNGARIVDLEPYWVNGSRRFAAVMVNNSIAVTTRVGQILRGANSGGSTGLYLKQVNGPVLANLQERFVFEPASTIKTLIALHAIQQVQAGNINLRTGIDRYQAPTGTSCPGNTVIGTESVSTSIRQMLVFSDNTRTRQLADEFGYPAINGTATNIGLTDTRINHVIGCGGPIPNQLTLEDAAIMYEGIEDTSLVNAASRGQLYARMAPSVSDFTGIQGDVNAIVDQEAPRFGLSAAQRADFKSKIRTHYKAGGYGVGGKTYLSVSGSAEVPRCWGRWQYYRDYVFGIFVHGATDNTKAGTAFNGAKTELLREQIRSALSTWHSCN